MKSNQNVKVLNPEVTLEQMITSDQTIAELLASIGLDAFQHQEKTIRQVCLEKQWNEEEVLAWIRKNQYLDQVGPDESEDDDKILEQKNIARMCDYLEDEYHVKVRELLEDIHEKFPRVCKIHGQQYPWLKQVHWQFENLHDDLKLYLKFEREKFFYFIRQLHLKESQVMDGLAQSLKHSIDVLGRDHNRLTQSMKEIQKVSRDFYLPEGSCTTFRIVMQELKDLFDKLKDHFKAEETYLIPAVRKKLHSV
jgi:iron-sulfur cluster repair di-iron protein